MKVGMRKPSLKRSISARTTGRVKREINRSINPLYGKKGTGWIKNPKKAAYNKVYHAATFGVSDLARAASVSGSGKKASYKAKMYDFGYKGKKIDVLQTEKELGIDIKEYTKVLKLIVLAIILLITANPVFIMAALVLIVYAVKVMAGEKYKTAFRWHKAVYEYSKGNNDKSRRSLEKLPDSEKEREAYTLMEKLLNGGDKEELDAAKPHDYKNQFEEMPLGSQFEDGSLEKEVCEKVESVIINSRKDAGAIRVKRTGVYMDFYTFRLFLRVKAGGKKRYILSYIDDLKAQEMGFETEELSKAERAEGYKSRITLSSVETIEKFKDEIIKNFEESLC